MRAFLPAALAVAILAVGPTGAEARTRHHHHGSRAAATALDPQAVNDATYANRTARGVDPLVLKASVLLDRAHVSPGMIDGRDGENLHKALAAYQSAEGLPATGKLDQPTFEKLSAGSADPVLVRYDIRPEDTKGPFLDKIPAKMEDMQGLKSLGYTGPRELLSEKFHVSEALLGALNPGQSFEKPGESIWVPAVATRNSDPARKGKVARIAVDKAGKSLAAFDAEGKQLAFYPASIGSADKPAPSGTFEVKAVAENPTYTYNPDYHFKGVKSAKPFDIAGGPNNPVGAVWIDLSAESYGIHGTPEPDRVGKTYSHGCVRLTNWDAKELAAMVHKGTKVEFGG